LGLSRASVALPRGEEHDTSGLRAHRKLDVAVVDNARPWKVIYRELLIHDRRVGRHHRLGCHEFCPPYRDTREPLGSSRAESASPRSSSMDERLFHHAAHCSALAYHRPSFVRSGIARAGSPAGSPASPLRRRPRAESASTSAPYPPTYLT
jgi:hypothetical protein